MEKYKISKSNHKIVFKKEGIFLFFFFSAFILCFWMGFFEFAFASKFSYKNKSMLELLAKAD